jgi:hypothetical protein
LRNRIDECISVTITGSGKRLKQARKNLKSGRPELFPVKRRRSVLAVSTASEPIFLVLSD